MARCARPRERRLRLPELLRGRAQRAMRDHRLEGADLLEVRQNGIGVRGKAL